MKYVSTIDLSNKNNSHTLAFDRIQDVTAGCASRILEVGCSAGYFGSALVDCGHEVWGVEPDSIAAEEAGKWLSNVFCGLLDDFFDTHPTVRFDIIVFGDVLEHLDDAVTVLVRCKQFLNPEGSVIASVPNVSHLAIRAMLLDGRWDYSDLGILDRTHLRFYTRETLIDLFSQSAYRVSSVNPVQLSVEQVDEFCNLNLSRSSISTVLDYAKDIRGYDFQYVVLASPTESAVDSFAVNDCIKRENGLRVVCFVHSVESSLVDIRLRGPLNRWAQATGGTVRIRSIFDDNSKYFEWGDVFVFQREAGDYVVKLIRHLKLVGKKVVFEVDDLLLELPYFLSHHQEAISINKDFIIDALNLSDAVSVSTEALGMALNKYNKNWFFNPNYSVSLSNSAKQFEVDPSNVTLIVASSDSVLVDNIVDPLRRLQNEYGVRIIGIGPPALVFIDAGLTVEHVENLQHVAFKRYIASIDNAIGVIPLDDSIFSSCKSAIKFFDYSLAGIPSVCSDVAPYSNHIVDKTNGLLVENTSESWYRAIEGLIVNSNDRRLIVEAARVYVHENCNLDISAAAWGGLFNSLAVEKSEEPLIPLSTPGDFLTKTSFKWVLSHLIKPASYKKILITVKRFGLSGLYRRVIRR